MMSTSLSLYAGDLDPGVRLAMTQAASVTGLVPEVLDPDLRALAGPHDLGGDRRLTKFTRVGRHLLAVHQQDRGQRNAGTDRTVDPVDVDHITDGHLLLGASATDDRVHRELTLCRVGPFRRTVP